MASGTIIRVVVLVAVAVLPACESSPDCPDQAGAISCGYCDLDRMLSDNPHAGMCTYCPTGSPCGDPCSGSCGGGGGGGGCGSIACGQVQNGIEVVGGIVPDECQCPSGTRYAGMDNVTPGGPWRMCTCN